MNLHNNVELFEEIVEVTAEYFHFNPFQIEKDYFVSLFLSEINKRYPDIVFKGGTSLSKCYDVINRFSEDIDLTICFEKGTSKNMKIKKQKVLREVIYECGKTLDMEFLNKEDERPSSRRDFNNYKYGYNKITKIPNDNETLEHILIETIITFDPFPCKELEVSNYVTKFLSISEETELIGMYNLTPFVVKTQTIERTFIDKIFALCDYYISSNPKRHSRHLYDLHMIFQYGEIQKNEILELLPLVADSRRKGKNTPSSHIGFKLVENLKEIIDTNFYQRDYNVKTLKFLSKKVNYEEVINSLNELIELKWIPEEIESVQETKERLVDVVENLRGF